MTREQAIEHGKEQLEIFGGEHKEFIELAIKALAQELKTGYWIDTNDDGFVYHRIYKCSHCGATVCEYPENMHEAKYNYCSTCGVKMVEPQEVRDKE